jgi:hypothetical protein
MRAREMQAEYFVDELSLIADDGRNDFMRRVREHGEEFVAVDREHLERSKIRIGRGDQADAGHGGAVLQQL